MLKTVTPGGDWTLNPWFFPPDTYATLMEQMQPNNGGMRDDGPTDELKRVAKNAPRRLLSPRRSGSGRCGISTRSSPRFPDCSTWSSSMKHPR